MSEPAPKQSAPKPGDAEYLQRVAVAVEGIIPDGHGFICLVMPWTTEDASATLRYVSTLQREDAIRVMKEFLIKCGHDEDWMKHLR